MTQIPGEPIPGEEPPKPEAGGKARRKRKPRDPSLPPKPRTYRCARCGNDPRPGRLARCLGCKKRKHCCKDCAGLFTGCNDACRAISREKLAKPFDQIAGSVGFSTEKMKSRESAE